MVRSAFRRTPPDVTYPTSDGKPMAETPLHRQNMTDLIAMLMAWFAGDPWVYVSGNMLMYYVHGNPRKHVSPDVFVTRGIRKDKPRKIYKVWEESKGPDVVIELTSKSTRAEDLKTKFTLYRDRLKVREYFLFDPYADYLLPPLQGYRLSRKTYLPIKPLQGRLPSKVLSLHLEGHGQYLRLYDRAAGRWLPTPAEALAQAEAARQEVAAENEQLRRELEALRRRLRNQR